MSYIIPYAGVKPQIDGSAQVHGHSTTIIGDFSIAEDSSIWFGAVVRGDVNYIRIGKRTNIQDNAVIHVTAGGSPTIIGDDVTVGHNAVIHACKLGDRVLVGMGTIVMDDVEVADDCLIAAGSLLPPGKKYPKEHLIVGSPAKAVRELTKAEVDSLKKSAIHYVNVSKSYM